VSPALRFRLQVAAALVLIVAYASLSHYCNVAGRRGLGAALALLPFFALAASVLRRSKRPLIWASVGVAAAIVLYDERGLLEKNFSLVYLLQECGMDGLLAVGFGRSLRAGETPLCTRLADRLHGPLTPAERRYTRQVTLAWTLLFVALVLTTLGLYFAAPLAAWSLFVNFVTLPLIMAMFVAELAVRRRVLPPADRGSILAAVRVFFTTR
jgi:uncharacterized membrane protein